MKKPIGKSGWFLISTLKYTIDKTSTKPETPDQTTTTQDGKNAQNTNTNFYYERITM